MGKGLKFRSLAFACLMLFCLDSPVKAQQADGGGTRAVVSRVQFIGPMIALDEYFREGVKRTARRVTGAEGCQAPCTPLRPGMRVTVVGHSHFRDTKEMNRAMRSQIRANLVRDLLVEGGIPADRVWTIACGDAVAWAVNDERVEIVVEPENAQPTCG